MPRRVRCRRVSFIPETDFFSPAGRKRVYQDDVVLSIEEFEALRLKDYLNLEQEEAAGRMRVSRQTYQRVLAEARFKIADALTNGKGILIQGGDFCLGDGYCRRRKRILNREDSCHFQEATILKDGSEITLSKIAISAAGNNPESNIDARFGRCSHFMLWDPESKSFETIDNQVGESAHGAGTGAAQTLLKNGVKVLLTNKIGPKAFESLRAAGISIFLASENDTVAGTLEKYQAGKLKEIDHPNN